MEKHMQNRLFGPLDQNFAIKSPTNPFFKGDSLYPGKSSGLNGASSAIIQIPASFVVTPAAYRKFMHKNRLHEVVEGLLEGVNVKQIEALQRPAAQIKDIIRSAPIPKTVYRNIEAACQRMGHGTKMVWPANIPYELFHCSGRQEQCLYLETESAKETIEAVKSWWASLFDSTAIFYRELYGQRHRDAIITVVAQQAPTLTPA